MTKKKIVGLLVASVVAVSVVGGSLAWFTSTDSVVNKFATQGTNENITDHGNGVRVYEHFDKDKAKTALPGDKITKEVQAQNTATYAQFIRVKITKRFTDTPNLAGGPSASNPDLIVLELGGVQTDISKIPAQYGEGSWMDGGDGYYYLMGRVAPGAFSPQILQSVKLSGAAGNEYKGAQYEVIVDAESVQADNKAILDQWNGAKPEILNLLANIPATTDWHGQTVDTVIPNPGPQNGAVPGGPDHQGGTANP